MSAKLRLLIVDDEPRARSLICKMVSGDNEVEIAGECTNGFEAVEAVKRGQVDLMFLDVQMPELDGFAVLGKLQGWDLPTVVFVTAFDHYALRAFEVSALDYLLKPFDKDRFLRVLQRAKSQIRANQGLQQRQQIAELLERVRTTETYLDRIAIKENGRVLLLKTAEIEWIEAEDNYVRVHAGDISYLLRETLTNLEKKLSPTRFSRVHRSAIINLETLKEIHPEFHGEYKLVCHSGKRLTLSRSYRDSFFKNFGHPR